MKYTKNKRGGFGAGLGILTVIGVAGLLFAFIVGGMFISAQKRDVDLRTRASALQQDNKNEFDNMWKKISQVSQVSIQQKNALKEIFSGYAQARSDKNPNGEQQQNQALMRWVQESVPKVDTSIYNNVVNTITSSRDRFTFRQTSLIDLKREHDKFRQQFPNQYVLAILGRSDEIKITIITSDRSEKAFESGQDNDVDLPKG